MSTPASDRPPGRLEQLQHVTGAWLLVLCLIALPIALGLDISSGHFGGLAIVVLCIVCVLALHRLIGYLA